MTHRIGTGMAAIAAAALLAACGQSAADKAKKQVCDARADIQKQVSTLQNLTPSTQAVNQVKTSLTAIQSDIQKIVKAQPDLNKDRKQSVQSANEAFKTQIQGIVTTFTTNFSLSQAEQQFNTAVNQLVSSYKSTLGKIDCSS